jgi:hypothetical protein
MNPFDTEETPRFAAGDEVMFAGKRWTVSEVRTKGNGEQVADLARADGDSRPAVPLQYLGAITALHEDWLKSQ